MKKIMFFFVGISLLLGNVYGATQKKSTSPVKTIQTKRNMVLNQFTRGSIVSGTKGTGSVRRWYLFNEGSVGSSYTMLGKSQYVSVDLGYSTYIRSIESLFGGMSLMAGTEVSVPIYLTVRGKSNILSDNPALETKETQGLIGVGVQLPFMLGLEYKGFYINGLVGYTWLFMKDTYPSTGAGDHPSVQTTYDGLIYGGGLGYKISNVVNIGVRYVRGELTNRKNQTKFDQRAIDQGLEANSITKERGRDIWNVDYQRFYVFLSYIF
ncbi:hypothetical protein [Helicobacter sp. 11S03491-1]|uniref:hypothetical protein n=1 Tax=Helicobacter sp. 11S03491-1 TaxID=1476196 RepID=UPI000BA750EC|nr:hypothetical protein [Helicobacter sp. 11S03491-1]PAF42020.1 hypothetical protein BKH45_05420 [Helicobacter sp. 11S03491-1]